MLIEQKLFGIESHSICAEVIAKHPKSIAGAYEIASSKVLPNVFEQQEHRLHQLLLKHEDIFNSVACTSRGPPVKVYLKADTTPKFASPQDIPFALRDAYTSEIDAKISSGFIERVEYSRLTPSIKVNNIRSAQFSISELDRFDMFIIRQINQLPVTVERIAQETRDPHLGKILMLLEKTANCLLDELHLNTAL